MAGQNVCRYSAEGFPIFKTFAAGKPDFFVGLGDMIYAEGLCGPTGLYGNAQVPGDFIQATNLDNFRKHWKYNREEVNFLSLVKSLPYYGLWDDHRRKKNALFLTTDVHFAEVFRYRPFGDDWTFHEVVTGPLNAGIFPNPAFDATLGTECLFFLGPSGPLASWPVGPMRSAGSTSAWWRSRRTAP